MDLILLLLSLAPAVVLGFAAHRSSICSVMAVAEVLSTRRAYLLLCFLKTILWTLSITSLLIWLLPTSRAPVQGWELSIPIVTGGFIFGVGGALNGGCAFSTLWKLGSGQLRMLLTLVSFCLGFSVYVTLVTSSVLSPHRPGPISDQAPGPWAFALIVGLGVWVVWESGRLWRRQQPGMGWTALVGSDFYRLSTGAALLGLSNAILYALHGSWFYIATLSSGVKTVLRFDSGPSTLQWGLFAALLGGTVLSAWHRGSFRLDWFPSLSWARNLVGGMLMGLGAGMAAGGNAGLVLNGIPRLSPHALPAFAALIVGIAVVLTIERLIQGTFMQVDCGGDICGDKAGT